MLYLEPVLVTRAESLPVCQIKSPGGAHAKLITCHKVYQYAGLTTRVNLGSFQIPNN